MSSVDKLTQLTVACKNSIYITINGHRNEFEDVAEYLANTEEKQNESLELDSDVRETMINLNKVVEVRFYPYTRGSFYQVFHYDLNKALDEALSVVRLS